MSEQDNRRRFSEAMRAFALSPEAPDWLRAQYTHGEMTAEHTLHDYALDYRTAEPYPETVAAWERLETFVRLKIEQAVLAERAACEIIAEQHALKAYDAPFKKHEDTHVDGYQDAANDIAAAIHQRTTSHK